MPRRPSYRAMRNEINHPYVIEVSIVSDGLDVELSRRIIQFHKSRQVELRYGRRLTTRRGTIHYGWCFSDLLIARDFAEQFGGEFRKRGSKARRVAANFANGAVAVSAGLTFDKLC
jgi:hypothetical protein